MKVAKEDIVEKLTTIDLLICSSGFEDRSVNLVNSLNSDFIKHAIIFHLDDTYIASEKNLMEIQEKLPGIRSVEYPKNNSLEAFDIFYNELQDFNASKGGQPMKVVLDISTFTREVLLILIKVLSLKRFSNLTIKVVYTPNESYSNDGQINWMTKGIREIRSIIGYSGLHSPSKKLLLLILNGFEEERTEQIIESFEPERIVLGKPNANDSINSLLNGIACSKFEHIKAKYINIVNQEFEFSCTDINFTISELTRVIEENSDYNIVISPLNNKVSTVAAAVVALRNEDIQICYASANQYNIDVKTKASDYFLVYNLNELLTSSQEA